MTSDRVILESPLSYTGSAKRIWRMRNRYLRLVVLFLAWDFITCYYLSFGVLLFVPGVIWRIWRRSVRREHQNSLRHLEMLAA
jgi:hypothetical protein